VKIEYDSDVDALYIMIQGKEVAHTKELEEGVNIDYDCDEEIIGMEILVATERLLQKDNLIS